jgi:hypothetical protein
LAPGLKLTAVMKPDTRGRISTCSMASRRPENSWVSATCFLDHDGGRHRRTGLRLGLRLGGLAGGVRAAGDQGGDAGGAECQYERPWRS